MKIRKEEKELFVFTKNVINKLLNSLSKNEMTLNFEKSTIKINNNLLSSKLLLLTSSEFLSISKAKRRKILLSKIFSARSLSLNSSRSRECFLQSVCEETKESRALYYKSVIFNFDLNNYSYKDRVIIYQFIGQGIRDSLLKESTDKIKLLSELKKIKANGFLMYFLKYGRTRKEDYLLLPKYQYHLYDIIVSEKYSSSLISEACRSFSSIDLYCENKEEIMLKTNNLQKRIIIKSLNNNCVYDPNFYLFGKYIDEEVLLTRKYIGWALEKALEEGILSSIKREYYRRNKKDQMAIINRLKEMFYVFNKYNNYCFARGICFKSLESIIMSKETKERIFFLDLASSRVFSDILEEKFSLI